MTEREKLTALLWEVHEAAQDASNEPTRANLNRWRTATKKATAQIALFHWEAARIADGTEVTR